MNPQGQRGFINLMGLFAMTIMISFAIVIAFLLHITQSKSEFRNLCYLELPKWQSDLESATNAVLTLNPIAVQLRIQITNTTAQWLAASFSNNHLLALQLLNQLSQLKLQQRQLGQKQKALIQSLEWGLNTKLALMPPKIIRALGQNNSAWSEFVAAFDLVTLQPIAMRLPIETDEINSPAPVYRIKPNLESATRLTANWKSSVFANTSNQTLLDQNTKWGFSCTVEQRMKKSYGVPVTHVKLETLVKADRL